MDRALLSIYLEDHLALATGGLRLARRCLRENRGSDLGVFLVDLVVELEEDHVHCETVVRSLRHRPSALKRAVAVLGELAGRLKLNGRLLGYSDLSRLEELEALLAGTQARAAMWRTLAALAAREGVAALGGVEFDALARRAEARVEPLERHRMAAGRQAFTTGGAGDRSEAALRPIVTRQ